MTEHESQRRNKCRLKDPTEQDHPPLQNGTLEVWLLSAPLLESLEPRAHSLRYNTRTNQTKSLSVIAHYRIVIRLQGSIAEQRISPLKPQQLMANGCYDITITNLVLRLHKA